MKRVEIVARGTALGVAAGGAIGGLTGVVVMASYADLAGPGVLLGALVVYVGFAAVAGAVVGGVEAMLTSIVLAVLDRFLGEGLAGRRIVAGGTAAAIALTAYLLAAGNPPGASLTLETLRWGLGFAAVSAACAGGLTRLVLGVPKPARDQAG